MLKIAYKKENLVAAWNLIQQAQKITLLTHHKPDADGVSASAAFAHVLEKMGKQVNAIYPTKPDAELRLQPHHVTISQHPHIPDLIITLDTANYDRLYYPDAFKNIPLINIDHHLSNSITGTFNFNNPATGSTCEELYVLLQQWAPASIDRYVAECLLFGILYDTQVFSTPATTQQTLRIAADLIDFGISMSSLCMELYATKTPQMLSLWGSLLSKIKTTESGKALCLSVTHQDLSTFKTSPEALNGLSNFLWQYSTTDVSILLTETEPGTTKASLRSKVTDVNAVASRFGGGGHKHASGIKINKPIADVEQELMQCF